MVSMELKSGDDPLHIGSFPCFHIDPSHCDVEINYYHLEPDHNMRSSLYHTCGQLQTHVVLAIITHAIE